MVYLALYKTHQWFYFAVKITCYFQGNHYKEIGRNLCVVKYVIIAGLLCVKRNQGKKISLINFNVLFSHNIKNYYIGIR